MHAWTRQRNLFLLLACGYVMCIAWMLVYWLQQPYSDPYLDVPSAQRYIGNIHAFLYFPCAENNRMQNSMGGDRSFSWILGNACISSSFPTKQPKFPVSARQNFHQQATTNQECRTTGRQRILNIPWKNQLLVHVDFNSYVQANHRVRQFCIPHYQNLALYRMINVLPSVFFCTR